jgi:hypothetical protein
VENNATIDSLLILFPVFGELFEHAPKCTCQQNAKYQDIFLCYQLVCLLKSPNNCDKCSISGCFQNKDFKEILKLNIASLAIEFSDKLNVELLRCDKMYGNLM